MKDFVTVSIGRNDVSQQPMSTQRWLQFQDMLRSQLAGEVVGRLSGTSEYNGVKESTVSIHLLTELHDYNRDILARLARYFFQDAIAYVISTPDSLVSAKLPTDTYL